MKVQYGRMTKSDEMITEGQPLNNVQISPLSK